MSSNRRHSRILFVSLLVAVTGFGGCSQTPSANGSPNLFQPGDDGVVEIEAEQFHESSTGAGSEWTATTAMQGFSGASAMEARSTGSAASGDAQPRLSYRIEFAEAGDYYLWIRGYAKGRGSDSLQVGTDGEPAQAVTLAFDGTEMWTWEQHTSAGERAKIRIDEPGLHSLDFWMREEGLAIDKFALTLSDDYLPLPSPESILWFADHEDGTLEQWERADTAFNCGGEFNNDGGLARVSDSVAHTGKYSAELVLKNVSGSQGTRLFRGRCENREQSGGLYYGAWYYIPRVVRTPAGWWNIWQWKSRGKSDDTSRVMWVLDLLHQGDGMMALRLRDKHDGSSKYHNQEEVVPFPIAQWVHLEAFYLPSAEGKGKVVVWQDGKEIFHFENVTTARPKGDSRWSVNNYTAQIRPDTVAIYVDDATISMEQVGPREFALRELASHIAEDLSGSAN